MCAIPNWEGSEYVSQPFLGVRTFMQPAKARNPVLAQSFLYDYAMTTEFMDAMFAVDPRPPAWLESYEKAAADPVIKGFGDYGAQGDPDAGGAADDGDLLRPRPRRVPDHVR